MKNIIIAIAIIIFISGCTSMPQPEKSSLVSNLPIHHEIEKISHVNVVDAQSSSKRVQADFFRQSIVDSLEKLNAMDEQTSEGPQLTVYLLDAESPKLGEDDTGGAGYSSVVSIWSLSSNQHSEIFVCKSESEVGSLESLIGQTRRRRALEAALRKNIELGIQFLANVKSGRDNNKNTLVVFCPAKEFLHRGIFTPKSNSIVTVANIETEEIHKARLSNGICYFSLIPGDYILAAVKSGDRFAGTESRGYETRFTVDSNYFIHILEGRMINNEQEQMVSFLASISGIGEPLKPNSLTTIEDPDFMNLSNENEQD